MGRSPKRGAGARLVVVLLVAAGTGCVHVSGSVPAAGPAEASGRFRAGFARADLTPIPGIAMAGHSRIGRVSRGTWTRLHARAVYLEDGRGRGLVLVQCELWSVSGGLSDRVAELVATDPALRARMAGRRLGREQIVLAATHTHHSPGLFSTDPFFATFSGAESGFDPALFEFLARRIAGAIADAVASAVPAHLHVEEVTVPSAFRNRSMKPFRANPEADALLRANADLPLCPPHDLYPDREACRAIDPRVVVLRAVDEAGGTVGALVVFAAHPTLISHRSSVYSADLHGAVAVLLEQRLAARRSDPALPLPVVAVFNGAEGDVSGTWVDQTRADVLRVAGAIVERAWPALRGGPEGRGRRVDGDIQVRLARVGLRGRRVAGNGKDGGRTAWIPMPGRASAGGAEDGRSGLAPAWFGEGRRGLALGPHGSKIGTIDLVELFGITIPPFWLTRLMTLVLPPPKVVAIGVYRVGGLRLAALPGEFTTIQGRRIAADLAPAGGGAGDVVLIGLAHDYAYYFATPEEYDLQHYEGSSTLYGRWSGPLVQSRLARLAATLDTDPGDAPAWSYHHTTGVRRSSDTRRLDDPADLVDEGTRAVAGAAPGDAADSPRPRICWRDVVPRLEIAAGACGASPGRRGCTTPRVAIEVRVGEAWRPHRVAGVREDDDGLRFLTLAGRAGDPSREATCWCATWLASRDSDPKARYRFVVDTLAGERRHSTPFDLRSPRSSDAAICSEPEGAPPRAAPAR